MRNDQPDQVAVLADYQGVALQSADWSKIAHAFEMNSVALSQNLTRESAEKHGAHLVSKEELFRTADIVTIHLYGDTVENIAAWLGGTPIRVSTKT